MFAIVHRLTAWVSLGVAGDEVISISNAPIDRGLDDIKNRKRWRRAPAVHTSGASLFTYHGVSESAGLAVFDGGRDSRG